MESEHLRRRSDQKRYPKEARHFCGILWNFVEFFIRGKSRSRVFEIPQNSTKFHKIPQKCRASLNYFLIIPASTKIVAMVSECCDVGSGGGGLLLFQHG